MQSPFQPSAKMGTRYHIDKAYRWMNNNPLEIEPSVVEISPTNRCNHNCKHCLYAHVHEVEYIPVEILEELIDDLARMNVPAINWTGGGEPLLYEEMYGAKIPYRAAKCGIKQGLFTNGSRMCSIFRMEQILETHDWIRISLDAATAETHQKVHGSNDWEIILRDIQLVLHWRETLKSQCTIGIGMVVTPQNYHEMGEFLLLQDELGVDYAQLKPSTHPNDWGVEAIKQNIDAFYDTWEQVQRLHDSDGSFITKYKWDDVFAPKCYDQCYAHYFIPYVGGDSKVYLCPSLQGFPDYVIGDLTKNSFREIWESIQRKSVIKKLNETVLDHCVTACRGHEINKFLWNIDHCRIPHKEFI